MENEKLFRLEREISEMPRLSIDDMLNLAGQVKDWKAIRVARHLEKEYSYFQPDVYEFQSRIGEITLDLESSSANSFSRWYRLTASSPLNNLGNYRGKESKCPSRLVELFSGLEERYIQNYLEKVKLDMKNGLDEARRLIVNK